MRSSSGLMSLEPSNACQFNEPNELSHFGGLTTEHIEAQLRKILGSDEFRDKARSAAFLRFIVEEKLAGRERYLKAFTIAQAVFDRADSFDAQFDPCVRIAARRVRDQLERYYLATGKHDPIVISVPKGGYTPYIATAKREPHNGYEAAHFQESQHASLGTRLLVPLIAVSIAVVGFVLAAVPRWETRPPEQTSQSKIAIRVEPFAAQTDNAHALQLSMALNAEIIAGLVNTPSVLVMASEPSSGTQTPGVNPTFLLQGSVALDEDKVRLLVRLVRTGDGVVTYSSLQDESVKSGNKVQSQLLLGHMATSAIADSLGLDVKKAR